MLTFIFIAWYGDCMNLFSHYFLSATVTQLQPVQSSPLQPIIFIILYLIGISLTIFSFWMFIDCILKPVKHKALWLIAMFFTAWVGAILYFFVGRNDLSTSV
jgi:phosphotransferase system  glucose/maltose/N-acetylglucosamine-specific IIC component